MCGKIVIAQGWVAERCVAHGMVQLESFVWRIGCGRDVRDASGTRVLQRRVTAHGTARMRSGVGNAYSAIRVV